MLNLILELQAPEVSAGISERLRSELAIVQYMVQPVGNANCFDKHLMQVACDVRIIYNAADEFKDTLVEVFHSFPVLGAKVVDATTARLANQEKAVQWLADFDSKVAVYKGVVPKFVEEFVANTAAIVKASEELNSGQSKTFMEALRVCNVDKVNAFASAELDVASSVSRCGRALLLQSLSKIVREGLVDTLAALQEPFKQWHDFLKGVYSNASIGTYIEIAKLAVEWAGAAGKGFLDLQRLPTATVDKQVVNDMRNMVRKTCDVCLVSPGEPQSVLRTWCNDVFLPV